jgi:hypothetical protein
MLEFSRRFTSNFNFQQFLELLVMPPQELSLLLLSVTNEWNNEAATNKIFTINFLAYNIRKSIFMCWVLPQLTGSDTSAATTSP